MFIIVGCWLSDFVVWQILSNFLTCNNFDLDCLSFLYLYLYFISAIVFLLIFCFFKCFKRSANNALNHNRYSSITYFSELVIKVAYKIVFKSYFQEWQKKYVFVIFLFNLFRWSKAISIEILWRGTTSALVIFHPLRSQMFFSHNCKCFLPTDQNVF